VITGSSVCLDGDLVLQAGRLDVKSSWFWGSGALNLSLGTLLKVTGDAANAPPTVVRSRLTGTGEIVIDASQLLTLAGQAVLDMSDGQGSFGTVTVNGKLIVQDEARVENSDVTVRQADITTSTPIQYNDVYMLDAVNSGGSSS